MFNPEDLMNQEDPGAITDFDAMDMSIEQMTGGEMMGGQDTPQETDEHNPYGGGDEGTYGYGGDGFEGDMGDMEGLGGEGAGSFEGEEEGNFEIYDEATVEDPEELEARRMALQAQQLESQGLSEDFQGRNMEAATQERTTQRKLGGM